MNNLNRALLVLVLFAVFSPVAGAANEDLKARESMSEKARARLYDGGIDEQPLTVQQSLTEPRAEGSETQMQRKLLNATGEESPEAVDETSSGF